MDKYTKLCEEFIDAISKQSPDVVFKHFFNYPEREDFLNLVKLNLGVLCIRNEASKVIIDAYNVICSVLENPDKFIKSTQEASKVRQKLLDMFMIKQLDYPTNSVEYVDGKLLYSSRQIIHEFVFKNEFYLDRYSNMSVAISLVNSYIKRNNEGADVNAFLKDRLKILKRLSSIFKDTEDTFALVKIDRKNPRLKVSKTYDENDGMLCITIN